MADNSSNIAEALRKSAPELYRRIDGEWFKGEAKTRGARRAYYRGMFSGEKAPPITDKMREALRIDSEADAKLNEFNLNYIPIIIDKEAARLSVDSFDLGTDQANQWLQERLDASKFDILESMQYRGSLLDGDSYLIVDPKRVVLKAVKAYDGYDGVSVIFDENGNVQWACNIWCEGSGEAVSANDSDDEDFSQSQIVYIIIYYENKIETWEGSLNGSELKPSNYFGESSYDWPLPELPVFPFVNKRNIHSFFGEGEALPAIPSQNMLNRILHDLAMAAEIAGFPVPYVVGVEVDTSDGVTPATIMNFYMKDAEGNAITEFTEEQARVLSAIR